MRQTDNRIAPISDAKYTRIERVNETDKDIECRKKPEKDTPCEVCVTAGQDAKDRVKSDSQDHIGDCSVHRDKSPADCAILRSGWKEECIDGG